MRKTYTLAGMLIATLILALGTAATADEAANSPAADRATTASDETPKTEKFRYVPPMRGAPLPKNRVGGGTRGPHADPLLIDVITPDHRGLTTSDQPALFWFISAATDRKIKIGLTRMDTYETVIDVVLTDGAAAGIHRLDLADYGVKLDRGVEYAWGMAVVDGDHEDSGDLVAKGSIVLDEESESLKSALANASANETPFVYAQNGIWFDAIANLCELIDRHPDNPSLRMQRAALCKEVKLDDVAKFDLAMVSSQ